MQYELDDVCGDQAECYTHGIQDITDEGSSKGYAGGLIFWANLACGCSLVDEPGFNG